MEDLIPVCSHPQRGLVLISVKVEDAVMLKAQDEQQAREARVQGRLPRFPGISCKSGKPEFRMDGFPGVLGSPV